MYRGVKRIYDALGIKDVTFHDLSHEFGGHAVDSQIDVRMINAALGHSSAKSTYRYTRTKGAISARILDRQTKRER